MENKEIIKNAITFIQKNSKENLSLQSIADNAGFSLTYFDAVFQKHTGYSPVEYSRIYKLTRAALELRRSDKTILNIALDHGYASPESFTRAFKTFYSISPNEYRKKYVETPITWKEISGKIAISHFKKAHPELKKADIDAALDFCFTHDPLVYAEDIVNMVRGDVEILTLGNTEPLEHFICVADYNNTEPAIDMICTNEKDALLYLKLLTRAKKFSFSIHKRIGENWDEFDSEIAKAGIICRYGYDMIYQSKTVDVPEYKDLEVRELHENYLPLIWDFRRRGGCADCHVRALESAFTGKANSGLRGFGVFYENEIICYALPCLDIVRDMKKYDIGGIFTLDVPQKNEAIELIWKYIIDICLKEGSIIGNSNALEDENNPWENNSPLSVETCEKIGLIKIAKNCGYRK